MTNRVNTRELILKILLEVEEGAQSHVVIRSCLEKYQYLSKQERAFITRICEGTLEYRIQIDYILNKVSRVPVDKMKPVIREILRSGVYQLQYMDSVPDSAVCNEAVKLAQQKGFYNLKSFVNAVLRSVAREQKAIPMPEAQEDPVHALSVRYSMPEHLVRKWCEEYSQETAEKIMASFLEERPVTVRFRTGRMDERIIKKSLMDQGVVVKKAPYLPYAYTIAGFDHLMALEAFRRGWIQVQDVSSMLAAEIAAPSRGNYVIDVCAAPGGKSLHIGDKMEGFGTVDARDISRQKTDLIEENIARCGCINVITRVQDATVFDPDSECRADIVLADLPCSGYGVIGKKPEIKYNADPHREEELVALQRKILSVAAEYVKSRGALIFSTCTFSKKENEENMMWFLNSFPFRLESLDPYLPEELHCESTSLGYLQLLPGIHGTDGFFIAKFRRKI